MAKRALRWPENRKETAFYSDDKSVRITSSRLMAGNATYAMADITSVSNRTGQSQLHRPWPRDSRWFGLLIDGIAQSSGVGFWDFWCWPSEGTGRFLWSPITGYVFARGRVVSYIHAPTRHVRKKWCRPSTRH